MIVRISKGTFPLARLDEVEPLLADGESALRAALEAMPGLIHYFVGIDRAQGQVTNVSVWDSMEHAHAMTHLQAMLAQRSVLEAAGVAVETITNHDAVWTITPQPAFGYLRVACPTRFRRRASSTPRAPSTRGTERHATGATGT